MVSIWSMYVDDDVHILFELNAESGVVGWELIVDSLKSVHYSLQLVYKPM